MSPDIFDAGAYRHLLDGLDLSPAALCARLHGVMIHDHFGALIYPSVPPHLATASRQTRPVAARLAEIDAGGPGLAARPLDTRVVGTCRDFVLMFCAMARHTGRAARMRCGFSNYLAPPAWEDHWIAEYWSSSDRRWVRVDPQLDPAHVAHLKIGFDPVDIPCDAFLTGSEAWTGLRGGEVAPDAFGHGSARGAWFAKVNLMRDLLCLEDKPISDWDRWRKADGGDPVDSLPGDAVCDRLSNAGIRSAKAAPKDPVIRFDVPAAPFGGAPA